MSLSLAKFLDCELSDVGVLWGVTVAELRHQRRKSALSRQPPATERGGYHVNLTKPGSKIALLKRDRFEA
jgi:hypothetical protein